jgi:hypothetical protein
MLAFHIGAGARKIAKLAGWLQSPELRREIAELTAELAWAERKVQALAESKDLQSAARAAPRARPRTGDAVGDEPAVRPGRPVSQWDASRPA